MTYKQKYFKEKSWKKRLIILTMYHRFKIIKHGSWTIRKTAAYFRVSIGLVSENLRLAEHLKQLKDYKTRESALELIKNK